jgi:hypothetical protein
MRKSKPTEPSIVPPISVLIVEGAYLLLSFSFSHGRLCR